MNIRYMPAAAVLLGALCGAALSAAVPDAAFAQSARGKQSQAKVEDYIREPMPAGFQVVNAGLEGPVFTDANGKTLYRWPLKPLRNGDAGEQRGKPTCDDTHYRVNAGLMSPYPGGLELPEVDTRPSCVQVWPPVYAAADAQPVGKWSLVTRKDGRKQWAYDGMALYTSVLDHVRGDVLGGTNSMRGGDAEGALREPVGPTRNIPPQFVVHTTSLGRMISTPDQKSVYVSDKDGALKSNCEGPCTKEWAPVLAPESIKAQGEWATFERAPGVKQWAFRNQPVYTHLLDTKFPSQEGSDIPGWHNVYTQAAPAFPKGFTTQLMDSGVVLADAKGRTIYLYNCNDDALDQLSCNHPDEPQAYRFAICGKGDPKACLRNFPYVMAGKDARSDSHIWSVMDIDPMTGRKAKADQPGALHVWAYRDRPVYLCGRDQKPGDFICDSWGEMSGHRNGYKAFWLRDAFGRNAV